MIPQLQWTVVVPVKRRDAAKTRLDASDRGILALAFALDVVAAALDAPRVSAVVVVTSDPEAAEQVQALGALLVDDPGAGLNAAVGAGIAAARSGWGVAVVPSDLPALSSRELDAALMLAERHPLSVVGDAEAVGTTLLAAHPERVLVARFGGASLARHVAAGHVLLDIDADSGLRRDVDTSADLADAVARGLGAHTTRALAARSR